MQQFNLYHRIDGILLASSTFQLFRESLSEKVHATIPKGIASVAGGILVPGVLLIFDLYALPSRGSATKPTQHSCANTASYAGYERYCGRLWVHCSSKKFERMAREAMDVCLLLLKENNKSRFDSFSVRNSVFIIPILPFGIVACTFFSDNLSQNSCMVRASWLWRISRGLEPIKTGELFWLHNKL